MTQLGSLWKTSDLWAPLARSSRRGHAGLSLTGRPLMTAGVLFQSNRENSSPHLQSSRLYFDVERIWTTPGCLGRPSCPFVLSFQIEAIVFVHYIVDHLHTGISLVGPFLVLLIAPHSLSPFSLGTILTALHCTFSRHSLSVPIQCDPTPPVYRICCGRTYYWYSLTTITFLSV